LVGGYDPIELSRLVEEKVAPVRGGVRLRRYYRFRRDRWYGGVVTGDVVGCNLRCKFCWAWRFTWTGYDKGALLSPREAAEKLIGMARRYGVSQVRLSGGEPTLGWEHTIAVIESVTDEGLNFILETNGILIGYDERLAEKLASFHGAGIEVRISLKGTSPEEFHMLTSARPEAWYLQVEGLKRLVELGLEPCDEVYAAVMLSFTDERGVRRVKRLLSAIHPRLVECIDPEYVILYKHVVELLKRTGLKPRKAYRPGEVPPELV
jgi:uncharacterized Fe-S cluster-containing radical SAM superfamily protein